MSEVPLRRFVRSLAIGFALTLTTLVLAALPAAASAAGSEGSLTQKSGTEACVSESGTGGLCADGVGLNTASSVTVSPDGKSAYVVSQGSSAVAVFDRSTITGALTQKTGTDACISESGTGGTCTDGVGLNQPVSVTVSPDGKSAYVASFSSNAVAVFDRNTTTGALTQKSGTEACVSESGTGGLCADGVGLDGASSVTISPDGKSAYVASAFSDAVAVFDRNTTTGALTQKSGTEACVSETGTGGLCTDGVGLDSAGSVTVSPDGKSAYVASYNSDAVAAFDRNTTTGALTQKSGAEACISETGSGGLCTDGVALDSASSVTVSPDGKSAYVTSFFSTSAVAVFDRNTTTGALTQKSGTEACVSETGTAGACTDGVALDAANSVTVSPDGRSAYVASFSSDAVAVFDRNTTTGALTQKSGTEACISEDNAVAGVTTCTDGVALNIAASVTVSPDGKSAYVASQGGAVAVFDRTPDTTPPDTQIDSGPSEPTGDATPSFEFSSESGATFECRVDTDAFASCSSPETVAALTDGSHAFEVRATDQVGNTDPTPATRSFTVDTTPPDTTIDSGPSGTTGDATPSFEFSSESGATFECRVDTDAFASCSSPETVAALTDGSHTFEVRATDQVGNTDPTPATRSFTVDTTPPDTTIDSGPSGPTGDATPSFEFSSEPGATFECRVDSDAFSSCSSPEIVAAVTDGSHTFEVRATDQVGNTDPTPATRSFTVDTTPPDTTIDSGPAGTITTSEATFTFSGDPASDTNKIQCRIDSEPFADCTSPKTFTGLSDGPHTATFRAEDAAGNQDPTPATRTFTIDTTVDPPVVDPPVVDPPVDPPVGKAKIGKVKVKGPAKVKKGKKATYKVKVTNSGNAAATGVKLKVKGKGVKAKKSVGKIAAGKAKTVKVKLKPKKPGKIKVSFKVTSKNAGGKTVKKKIKVKK